MPTIELSGGTLHYDVQGSGDALVLVPGFASGAWSWAWQTSTLSESFEVVTFDPLGVARSSVNDGVTVSIPAIADDIAKLLDTLGITRAHLLGISFGGFVALQFALRHPKRLRRLVLASTSFGGPNHVAPAINVLAAFASTDGLNTAERIRKYITLAFTPEFVETHGDTVQAFCRLRQQNVVPREVYMQQLQAALGFDVESVVPDIAAETLVITGEDDIVVPAQNSRNLAAALSSGRLVTLKGSGHMAFVENADEFNRIVTGFLTQDQDL